MVIKLFKHDVIDSYKAYAPVFLIIVIGTLLTITSIHISSNRSLEVINSFIFLALFALMITVFVLAIKANIYVMYTSMYKQNGYRLFTLPVKSWQIIVSKLLVTLFWSVVVSVAFLIAFAIIALSFGELNELFTVFASVLNQIKFYLDSSVIFFAIADNVIQVFISTLILLFSGAVAHSSRFQKNRGLITLGVFLLITTIMGQVSTFVDTSFISVISNYTPQSLAQGVSIPVGQIGGVLLYELLVCGFLFFGTMWFWENKLEVLN